MGFKQVAVPVKRAPRAAGKPGYTIGRLFKLAFDGIFAFSVAPLRFAAVVGSLATLGASIFAAYSIYVRVVLGESPRGFTALIVAITFFSGVQLLSLGLIGEYLGRVYDETKARPQYIVSEVVGRQSPRHSSDTSLSSEPPFEPVK